MRLVKAKYAGQYRCLLFDAGELTLGRGAVIVVETDRGPMMAEVCGEAIEEEAPASKPPRALRLADNADRDARKRQQERAVEALSLCREAISRRRLQMKLVDVEPALDGSKMTFLFTAEARVDFRELVRELASRYRTRIEMLQIGVRDAAKRLTGVGVCGRELCCSRFLDQFAPVSIKMAKDQCLALNDSKVSGVCGRLKCCLRYEHDLYCSFSKGLPKIGKRCITPDGEGRVTRHDPLQGKVMVALVDGKETSFDPGEVRKPDPPKVQPREERGPAANNHGPAPEDDTAENEMDDTSADDETEETAPADDDPPESGDIH